MRKDAGWKATALPMVQNGGTLWPREVTQERSFVTQSLFQGTDRLDKSLTRGFASKGRGGGGGVSLPALRLETIRFGGAGSQKPITSWAETYHAGKRIKDAAAAEVLVDLWDHAPELIGGGWSTAIRDQDNKGPFGVDGMYGFEGPPAPRVQAEIDRQKHAKALGRFSELRAAGSSTARDARVADYHSVSKTSWKWHENQGPQTTRARRFDGHPAVQALVPMKSLHAMGAHHESPTYRVSCAAPCGC